MDKAELKQAARKISRALNEQNPHAFQQIKKLIQHMGMEFAQEHLDETLRIEAQGGMMLSDGSRRRTPGGVFLHIVKANLSPEMRQTIFRSGYKKEPKAQPPAPDAKVPEPTAEQSPPNEGDLINKYNHLPPDVAERVIQLELRAATLRERLAHMQAKGQRGIKMTQTLLKNTEKQIEALQAAHAE